MKKIIFVFLLTIIFSFSAHTLAATDPSTNINDNLDHSAYDANQPPTVTEYYQATVDQVVALEKDNDPEIPATDQSYQRIKIKLLEGPDKGQIKDSIYYPKSGNPDQKLSAGEKVYAMKVVSGDSVVYSVTDRYRINPMIWLGLIFILLVLVTAKFKGIGSLLGLLFSFGVIMKLIVPWILTGANPVLACAVGALLIAVVSIYLAHGFNLRTSVAVGSTIFIIILAAIIDYLVVNALHLYGTGTEDAIYAQFNATGVINLRGLLLGGILIGVLGVLDDITTAQVAVVDELKKANTNLSFKDLYERGMSVGKEHIASLINTLVLAYVGASFPLVLLFQQYSQPLMYTINSEIVAEEIGRTLVGSMALIIAVPITTAFAAYIINRRGRALSTKVGGHVHSH